MKLLLPSLMSLCLLLLAGCPSNTESTTGSGGLSESGSTESMVELEEGCILPTTETILSGAYKPLARPLFIYVNKKSLAKPNVRTYLEYYMNEGQAVVPDVGYVQLPEADLKTARQTLKSALDEIAAEGTADESVVKIDGSSTVFPISMRMAEDMKNTKNIVCEVGLSGTGGGFDKFARGEIDISDASRPIKDSEKEKAQSAGVDFIELKVAIDGISVVVNKENDWCHCMTISDLKKLWDPGSTIKKWNELNPAWPDQPIGLYGPDTKSGTYDYFTEEVIGKVPSGSPKSRDDYTPAVNDNTLVQGVAGDKYALGFFGFAYYKENTDSLKAVAIKNDKE